MAESAKVKKIRKAIQNLQAQLTKVDARGNIGNSKEVSKRKANLINKVKK